MRRRPLGYSRRATHPSAAGYAIADPDNVANPYDGSDVPGEFRRLTDSLGCDQLAVTLIRVPPHSDFEQGTGHYHDQVEELYLLSRGTLTMRFGDDIATITAPTAVRVTSSTPRSHRNEGDEPVELWAVSRKIDAPDATKIDDFWEASAQARQRS
jgi:mannose-6-phosphate isomerase-like protein (cupin superfamily)